MSLIFIARELVIDHTRVAGAGVSRDVRIVVTTVTSSISFLVISTLGATGATDMLLCSMPVPT